MDKIKQVIEYDYIFKIIFLGDTAVGKTSIVRRLRNKGFKLQAEPTIGLDFTAMYGNITHGKKIKFHVWDTAGQENFNSIIHTLISIVCYKLRLHHLINKLNRVVIVIPTLYKSINVLLFSLTIWYS